MDNYRFSLELEVRDYECDMSGIVNNANYMHYLEHARHTFLRTEGVNFSDWVASGIHLVVIRVELDFLKPLRAGDKFVIGVNAKRVSRLRFGMNQDIYRLPDNELMLKAWVIGTAINDRGRPKLPKVLEALLSGSMA